MRWSHLVLWSAWALACDGESTPEKPATPPAGPIATSVEKQTVVLSGLDRTSPEAEAACAAARAEAEGAAAATEPTLPAALEKLEAVCQVVDAWAGVLRAIPRADGAVRTAECTRVGEQLAELTRKNVDVAVLRDAHAKACRPPTPFVPTGELAKVGKLDPRSKEAISVCRDARTEALTVTLRDRLAGQEREKVLNVLCALPDLWHQLGVAADRGQTREARDGACIASRVWIGALAQKKQLKGRPLSLARRALKKSCRKWLRGDPITDLGKLTKLDPKSKDARGYCDRAAVYVDAHEAAGAKVGLSEGRDAACLLVEGWATALAAPCLTALDRLEKKKSTIEAAVYDELRNELRERCK